MSDPERDRALAHQPRSGPRRAVAAAAVVDAIVGGPAAAKIKRFLRVNAALARVLGERERARVAAVRLDEGTLTLEVADGVLLSELRNHRQQELLAALAAAGTGANRLAWRLAPTARRRPTSPPR